MKSLTLRRPRYAVASIATAALVLTACGGGGAADGDDGSTEVAEMDVEEAWLAHAQCMRDHGVNMPDPTTDSTGPIDISDLDLDDIAAADEACQEFIPEMGADFEMTPEQEAEMRDKELAMARCMRDHGIDFPDPSTSDNGVTVIDGSNGDPAEFDAAMRTCGEQVYGADGGFSFGSTSSVGQ